MDEVVEVLEVGEVVEAAEAAVTPWYPAWAPWVFWPLVVAVIVVVLTEPVKRFFYKRPKARWHRIWAAQKSHLAKAQLLLPWKAGIGAFWGVLLFPEAGLFDSVLLAGAAGGAVGAVSFTLYDGLMKVLRYLPEVAKARLGAGAGKGSDGEER